MTRLDWESLIALAHQGYSACEQAEAYESQTVQLVVMAKAQRRRERDALNQLARRVGDYRVGASVSDPHCKES